MIGNFGCPCEQASGPKPLGVWGSFGQEPDQAQTAPTPTDYTTFFQNVSTIVAPFASQLSDPVRRQQVLEAELRNALARGAPAAQINLISARLIAARQNAAIKLEGQQATREWRGTGQLAVGAGVVVAGAVAVYILVKAFR